jgi:hypothetical protein
MPGAESKLSLTLKYSLRGALGFGTGGLFVALMEWFVFSASYEEMMPVYYLLIAYFLCGAFGAMVLTWGLEPVFRGAAGFGCGFIIAAIFVFFTMISLQAGGKPEYGWGAAGCGIGFALGGGLGGLSIRRELSIVGGLAFGVAGAAWGLVVFWLAGQRKGALLVSILDYFGIVVFIFPYLLGGALFGAALGYMVTED